MIEITLKAANPVEAAILKARGVSQLARLMDVSRESIRTWRRDGAFPEDWIQIAAKASGLPTAVLRGG